MQFPRSPHFRKTIFVLDKTDKMYVFYVYPSHFVFPQPLVNMLHTSITILMTFWFANWLSDSSTSSSCFPSFSSNRFAQCNSNTLVDLSLVFLSILRLPIIPFQSYFGINLTTWSSRTGRKLLIRIRRRLILKTKFIKLRSRMKVAAI